MKKTLTLFAMAALLWSCGDKSGDNKDAGNSAENISKEDQPTKEDKAEANVQSFPDPDATGSFGAAVSAEGAMDAAQVLDHLDGQDSARVKLSGNISSCCQAKGCWMTMPLSEDQDIMVKFKDYAFFVPKNASGKNAIIEGWAYREVVSVDELRHYAEDAGKPQEEIDAITETEERITFMADGVLIADTDQK